MVSCIRQCGDLQEQSAAIQMPNFFVIEKLAVEHGIHDMCVIVSQCQVLSMQFQMLIHPGSHVKRLTLS